MNQTVKKSLIWGGGGLAAVLALVLILPFLIPLDAYKIRIEDAAGHATGRAFRIEGPLRLMLFPRLGVRAQEVTLANVPGGHAAIMASVGGVEISVHVLPLLTGRVAIDRIVLDRPTIALEVDPDGNPNWKFGKKTKPSQTKGTLTLPATTEFEGISIHDGRLTYDNARTGSHRAVEHVNVDVAITKIDLPVAVKGDFAIAERKLEFTAQVATLKTFLGSGTTTLQGSANSDLMQASFKGQMTQDGATDGRISLSSPSLRDLVAWLDAPLPGGGLGGLTLTSRIWNKEKVTRLEDLRVRLDGQSITGGLQIDARGEVPMVDGALNADRLDLNPYLAAEGNHEPEPAQEKGWSRKPISVAILKKFGGTLSISTGALKLRGLHLGKTGLKVENTGGVMTAWLNPISLYGGMGQAQLVVDARGATPAFHNVLQFTNVSLKPFLGDVMGVTSIEGSGALSLDVSSSGNSAYAIMHGLSGKGAIAGANGRFRGVDLGRVARSIQSILGGDATGNLASTEFSTMNGTFTIANGVLSNNDFRLVGPAVQVTGGGRIDIANRGIDFRIEPKAGAAGFSVGVPFRITGSWDHLHYMPDLADIIGGVVDNLKNGRAAFKGLFGGGGQQNNAPQDQKKKKKGNLLDALGIH